MLIKSFAFIKDNISLVCSTSSTALAAARGILIQLRFAALYLMHYRLFQQTLNTGVLFWKRIMLAMKPDSGPW